MATSKSTKSQKPDLVPKAETPEGKNIPPDFTYASDYQTIYTNFIQSLYTPIDISLILGISGGFRDGKWHVENKARIIMAPKEALIMLGILRDAINAYQKNIGPINTTPPQPKQEEKTEGD